MHPQQAKLLLVDSDHALVDLLKLSIQKYGYIPICAYSAEEGLECFLTEQIDLILLEVALPGMNGFDFCKTIRRQSDIPIIALSALTSTQDIINMLDSGADEYLTKPFQFAHLEALIMAQLRRRSWDKREPITAKRAIGIGPISLDEENRTATFYENDIKLSAKEFQVLECLIRRPDQPISVSELYEEVWGNCNGQESSTVTTTIQRLRSKLESDTAVPDLIVTMRGYGYKLSLAPLLQMDQLRFDSSLYRQMDPLG
ncbi:MAG: response regulator transcription factor [Chloroflexota bacterium]